MEQLIQKRKQLEEEIHNQIAQQMQSEHYNLTQSERRLLKVRIYINN